MFVIINIIHHYVSGLFFHRHIFRLRPKFASASKESAMFIRFSNDLYPASVITELMVSNVQIWKQRPYDDHSLFFTQKQFDQNERNIFHSQLAHYDEQTGLSSINQFIMCHIALSLQSADKQQNHCYYYWSSLNHLSISKLDMIYVMFHVSERHKIEFYKTTLKSWHFIVFIFFEMFLWLLLTPFDETEQKMNSIECTERRYKIH